MKGKLRLEIVKIRAFNVVFINNDKCENNLVVVVVVVVAVAAAVVVVVVVVVLVWHCGKLPFEMPNFATNIAKLCHKNSKICHILPKKITKFCKLNN